MYKKVDTAMNFVDREKEVIGFWKENDVFEDSVKEREGGEEFSFYDGPPTANGKPHIGHILTRVMKDIVPRYQTMKGKHVLRKAGWDTHGLPVELEVERLLGIDGKQDIEKYGIEPFIKKCKESVWKYKGEWERMSERVGYWADMENPYVTYDDKYIESVWWALKEIWKKGLLYKGHKIVPYCPRCGTALSSQRRKRNVGVRALSPQGHGKLLLPRLDDHALDAAFQRGAVHERGGRLRRDRGGRRRPLCFGAGAHPFAVRRGQL